MGKRTDLISLTDEELSRRAFERLEEAQRILADADKADRDLSAFESRRVRVANEEAEELVHQMSAHRMASASRSVAVLGIKRPPKALEGMLASHLEAALERYRRRQ